MSNSPIQISYSLEEVLTRIEKKVDEVKTDVSDLRKDINDLKVGQVRLEAELKGDIKTLDRRLSGQIKSFDERLSGKIDTLDAKVEGFGKRLENQEFVNRGILVALVVAILGSAAKLLGWVGNP